MNDAKKSAGTAGLAFVLILSIGAIALAGWSFTLSVPSSGPGIPPGIDSMGYHPLSVKPHKAKPWWREDEDTQGGKKRAVTLSPRGADEFKLSLPNSGLKDPQDMSWPYDDYFVYEMVRGSYPNYSVYPGKGKFINTYEAYENGVDLTEVFEYKWGSKKSTDILAMTTSAQFDAHRRVESITFNVTEIERLSGSGSGIQYETPLYEIHMKPGENKLHWTTTHFKKSSGRAAEKEKEKIVKDVTVDAPKDGFFCYSGADSPGLIATLLAAVELDGNEPASVWVLGGGNLAIFAGLEGTLMDADPIFTRVTVFPLETSDAILREWWEYSRRFFKYWMPPDDVRTFILFEEGANYLQRFKRSQNKSIAEEAKSKYAIGAGNVMAYVDEKGRVIRVEQMGGTYSMASELVKIGRKDTWWVK
jgi:hypothetical protein